MSPISFLDLDDVTLVGQTINPSFLDDQSIPEVEKITVDATIFSETEAGRSVIKPDIDHKEYRFF